VSEAFNLFTASKQYDDQKKSGHTTLLVKRSGDTLSIDLALIPPKSNLSVTFTVSSLIPTLFDTNTELWYSHYVLPATFVPRYSPPDFDTTHIQAPVSSGAQSHFAFSFIVSAPFASNISSFSYPNAILRDGKELSFTGTITKDLIVDITHEKSPNPTVEIYGENQVTQFVINGMTLPIESKQVTKQSIIFLIDRSGSMGGHPIAHVRRALSIFVHSLPQDCRFDLIGFGSTYVSALGGITKYNDKSLASADSYISMIEADFGGTEIYQPLEYILRDLKPDIVFLLTDGAVSNTENVLGLGRKYKSRISTFGIGNAASVDLVRGLAELTGGTHEFVDDPTRIEESVIRSLRTAIHPLLRDIQLECDCGKLFDKSPPTIGRDSLTTLRYFSNSTQPNCQLKLEGRTEGGQQYSQVFRTNEAHKMYSNILHTQTVVSGSNKDVISENETIELAKRLNLLTRFTSLLLYDNTTTHESVDQHTIFIGVPDAWSSSDDADDSPPWYGAASGFRGQPEAAYRMAAAYSGRQESGMKDQYLRVAALPEMKREMAKPRRRFNFLSRWKGPGDEALRASPLSLTHTSAESSVLDGEDDHQENAAPSDSILKLTRLQTANGSWENLEAVLKLVKVSDVSGNWKPSEMATALALETLREKGEEYRLIREKGTKWLEQQLGVEDAKRILVWAGGKLTK
jgi:hypothetical protein